jgi:hypothetical protein
MRYLEPALKVCDGLSAVICFLELSLQLSDLSLQLSDLGSTTVGFLEQSLQLCYPCLTIVSFLI